MDWGHSMTRVKKQLAVACRDLEKARKRLEVVEQRRAEEAK